MITAQNLPDAISFFIKDEDTFKSMQNDFSDILADLVSYKNNPNCSCKGRVNKYFSDKLTQDPLFLNKYIKDEKALDNELISASITRQQNNYSGKIIVIEKSEDAWRSLSTLINSGKFFRGFSVVERENELAVYFL